MGTPRYTGVFKAKAVSQVIDRGYSISEVARIVGVSWHSLHRWAMRPLLTQDGSVYETEEIPASDLYSLSSK